jgi:hypothetical protein
MRNPHVEIHLFRAPRRRDARQCAIARWDEQPLVVERDRAYFISMPMRRACDVAVACVAIQIMPTDRPDDARIAVESSGALIGCL